MTELLTLPPPPEAVAAMAAIPRSQIAPIVLGTQQGPDGHLGPEKAGAILMLQATFTDPEGSATFWKVLVPLFELLESAPGFIRRYGFADGPHNTLIAFWRTDSMPVPGWPRPPRDGNCGCRRPPDAVAPQ